MQSVLDTEVPLRLERSPALGDAPDNDVELDGAEIAPAEIVDAEFDEPKVAPATRERVFEPRVLTAAVRKKLGIPPAVVPAYRFGFAALMVSIVGVPMLMIGWYKATVALVFVALFGIPLLRWWERREIALRDRVFTHGKEVVARVLDVEPGGPDRNGKMVRVQFIHEKKLLAVSVFGCPFARKGLDTGDDVVLYHAEDDPMRCLIVERIMRSSSPKARKVRRAEGGGGGGCGKGACGAGGCGDGGCGAGGGGGCGTGGCGCG